MDTGEELIRVYTGSEVTVLALQAELEEIGVGSIIQNDYVSGISVGFMGGTPVSADLYIQQSDFKTAESLINEFIRNNN